MSSKECSIINEKDNTPLDISVLTKPLELNQVKEKLNFDTKPSSFTQNGSQGLAFNALLNYIPTEVSNNSSHYVKPVPIVQPTPVFTIFNPHLQPQKLALPPQIQQIPLPPQAPPKIFDFPVR